MISESSIMRAIQLAAPTVGARLWRNSCGLWELKDGRRLRTGLCVGSSDLCGLTSSGRFLAVEVKSAKGRLTDEQRSFLALVNSLGGIAFTARSVEDFHTCLKVMDNSISKDSSAP